MLYDTEQARHKYTAITEGRGYRKHWPHPPPNILKHKINYSPSIVLFQWWRVSSNVTLNLLIMIIQGTLLLHVDVVGVALINTCA